MTEQKEPPAIAARREREAARLRENLRRRKAQARERLDAGASLPADEAPRDGADDASPCPRPEPA